MAGLAAQGRHWLPVVVASGIPLAGVIYMSAPNLSLTSLIALLGLKQPGGYWRLLAILFAVLNFKILPFVWHFRVFYGLLRHASIFSSRCPPAPPLPSLFSPIIISTRCTLMEMDYNIHKSNSTYFSDLDISRVHLVTCLLKRGLHKLQYGDAAPVLRDQKPGRFGIYFAGVQISFRREVSPGQNIEIWTRVLAWDGKWLYLVSHFVEKGKAKPKGYWLQPWKKGSDKNAAVYENGSANGTANGYANGVANEKANGTINGKANGTANGYANGTMNGHANGTANGHANGTMNGKANGTANGHANGHANGTANGHANGTANGHANGTANGTANGKAYGSTNGHTIGDVNGSGKRIPPRAIIATAVSKYVFKQGRITIPPEMILRGAELLPPKPEGASGPSPPRSGSGTPTIEDSTSPVAAAANLFGILPTTPLTTTDNDDFVPPLESTFEDWDWATVERERQKGMKLAKHMAGLDEAAFVWSGEEGMALGEF